LFLILISSFESCRSFSSKLHTSKRRLNTKMTEQPSPERMPAIPLPQVILSNVKGTWAYDTMSRRVKEDILARIYEENDLNNDPSLNEAKYKLDLLSNELTHPEISLLTPIQNDGGDDVGEWNSKIMSPHFGKNWLDAPWLIAEFYFYRRIVEIFDFFTTKYDPFLKQKQMGVLSALDSMESLAKRLFAENNLPTNERTKIFLSTSLWGNRVDLSLWPASDEISPSKDELVADLSSNLLANDLTKVAEKVSKGGKKADIIVDNAGFELFCDLCLADHLISSKNVTEIVFHLKGHPTFVSDAMSKDMTWMISYFKNLDEALHPSLRKLGKKWERMIGEKKWVLKDHCYWAQPYPFWEMPEELYQEMGASSLIVVKGDANYRRLLGDRMWPLDAPFSGVASYWPAPVCALRTLKAELGCGMDKKAMKAASDEHKDWLVNGKYGVVQMFDPKEQG